MSIESAVAEYEAATGPRLREVLAEASRVPGLCRRAEEAGLDLGGVTDVAGLTALPVLRKDDLVTEQRAHPPTGGMIADDARVLRWFQSPGPLYEPQLADATWRWDQVLTEAGVGPGDVVLNCFGYHLSPAAAMLEQGAHALGASVVPGGIGNQDLQVDLIADLQPTAYTGLPSYLKALIDRFEASGRDRDRWSIRHAVFTAEPLPDSLRAELQAWVPELRNAYGTGETGLLAHETAGAPAMRIAEGDLFVQICDPADGAPIRDEREGEAVISLLRPEYPLLRFGTGDLSGWALADDGELRLRGFLGRTGEAVKVRGMFLHPGQAGRALQGLPGLADLRFVVDREDHRDQLRCRVVPDGSVPAEELSRAVADRIREALRFRAEIDVVDDLGEGEGLLLDRRTWD